MYSDNKRDYDIFLARSLIGNIHPEKKNEVEEEEKNETFLSGVRFWELLCGLFVHDVYRKMYAFENQHTNEKAQTNNSS